MENKYFIHVVKRFLNILQITVCRNNL